MLKKVDAPTGIFDGGDAKYILRYRQFPQGVKAHMAEQEWHRGYDGWLLKVQTHGVAVRQFYADRNYDDTPGLSAQSAMRTRDRFLERYPLLPFRVHPTSRSQSGFVGVHLNDYVGRRLNKHKKPRGFSRVQRWVATTQNEAGENIANVFEISGSEGKSYEDQLRKALACRHQWELSEVKKAGYDVDIFDKHRLLRPVAGHIYDLPIRDTLGVLYRYVE